MKTALTLATGLTLLGGGAASAQSFSFPSVDYLGGSVTAAGNYHDDSVPGEFGNYYTHHLTGTLRYRIADTIDVDFVALGVQETFNSSFFSQRLLLGTEVSYDFGTIALGGYGYFGWGDDGAPYRESVYGLFGEAEFGGLTIEAFAGEHDQAGNGDYEVGFGAQYDMGSNFSPYIAQRMEIYGTGAWWAQLTLGLDYDIPTMPITLSAEASTYYFSNTPVFDDWYQVSVLATWYFGGNTEKSIFHGKRSNDFYYD